jgi:hypothetical protein
MTTRFALAAVSWEFWHFRPHFFRSMAFSELTKLHSNDRPEKRDKHAGLIRIGLDR